MRVLVSDNVSQKGIDILRNAGLDVDVKVGLKPDELKRVIGDYDALVIRSATKVTADVLGKAEKLKVVGRAGSGVDNVDIIAASKKGVVVMNTPGGNTITTAEHTISMLLSMARSIPQATASMKEGKWEKKKFMGIEVYNKTLGIIGLGNIGSEVAKRAQGIGMQVIAFDPYLSTDRARALGVRIVKLEELFRSADFITIHSSLTKETSHLINRDTIAIMKEGVRLVNCARGGIVDEEALYDALKTGKIKAAAFDVFEKEPPGDTPLLSLDNFICTPHLGASTDEAQENVAVAVAEQIVDYLKNKIIRNAVNFPSISPDDMESLQPFVNLGERLGHFLSQFMDIPIREIVIEYKGEVSRLPTDPITYATLKGVLTPILDVMLNYVNAPFIAKERGITVKETTTDDAGDYISAIELQITGNGVSHSASGVLYGKKEPRVVELDRFPIEFIPEGDMLVISNVDAPGVIGNIGTLLGSREINIARMQWGREEKKGKAISIVTIEAKPTPELIKDLENLPNVLSIRPVSLPLMQIH